MRFSCWACDTRVLPSLLKRFVMASCWQALTNSFRGHAGSQGSFKETDMEVDQAPCCDLGARLQTQPAGLQRTALAQEHSRTPSHKLAHNGRVIFAARMNALLASAHCSAAFARPLANVHAPGGTRTRDTHSNLRVYPSVLISSSGR